MNGRNLTGYTVGIKATRKRPDRVKAMLQSCEAARRHDLWFSEQANIALKEANSPHATWLDPLDVRKRMKYRAKSRMDSVND